MEQVHIIGIDLAKQGFQLHGAPGRIGRVPQEADPGEGVGFSGFASAVRGCDGGMRERALLGPRDR